MTDYKASKIRCKNHRKVLLNMSQKVQALHLGGAFSSIEIVDLIYNFLISSKNDKFIMSKGHGYLAQCAVLLDKKILSPEDIENYCKPNGKLGGHPDLGVPGIEASTGSLGHGMGIATGIAQANEIEKKNDKTFVLLSDGELQEGSTWEALMMAANLNLKNLIGFIDHNGSQSFGVAKETHPKLYPIREKIISFGWDCLEVDGHNQKEILDKYFSQKPQNKPLMFLCNTIKGKGVSFMENKPIWHYRSPNKEEYLQAVKEIDNS